MDILPICGRSSLLSRPQVQPAIPFIVGNLTRLETYLVLEVPVDEVGPANHRHRGSQGKQQNKSQHSDS